MMCKITKDLIIQVEIDDGFINECNSVYNTRIDYIAKELSLKPDFYETSKKRKIRKLCNNEILDSKDVLDFDFASQSLVPLFDVMDNNYLCFDYAKKQFCFFNTIDEISSDYKESIMDLIDFLG